MGINLFSEKILQAICWTLLHSLWQGLVLASITGFLMIVSKKSSSTTRYNLISVVFVLFVIIVSFTFIREWSLLDENTTAAATTAATDLYQLPANAAPNNNIHSDNLLGNYLSIFINYFNTHASLIVTIWFIVFTAKCIRIFAGLVNIQRIRHYKISEVPDFWKDRIDELSYNLGIQKTITLLESAIVKVPVVIGILKPVILVPAGLIINLSPQEVESILIHELAHIRRRDYFFNLLQCFVDVLFFFNPAILWISSLIRNERENCCDDIAIQQTRSKKQFVQALVSFHQYNLSAPGYAMPFAEKKSRLLTRVQRIVNNNNTTLNPAEKIVLIVSLFLFSVIFISITNGQVTPQKKQTGQTKSAAQPAVQKSQKTNSQSAQSSGKKNNSSPNKKRTGASPATENISAREDQAESEAEQDANIETNESESLGYENISADLLERMKQHGVSEDFLKGLHDAGYEDISPEKAIQLKDHGIDAGYINEFKTLGFDNISLEKAQELRDHGVSAEFMRRFNEMGFHDISLDQAIQIRDHGVGPDFVMSITQLGFKDMSLDKLIELRDHGVNADFINDFRKAGFTNISLDKAQELRDHGVNISYISELRQLGFKDISLDKSIELRDHNVSIKFIEAMKKKTGSNLTLDEYIIMKESL